MLVWQPGQAAVQRPPQQARADLARFIAQRPAGASEGRCGESIATAAPHSTELLWLGPPLAPCWARALECPWEPHKYATAEAQAQMRATLLAWVEGYDRRDDDWSRRAHQRAFDACPRPQRRLTAADAEGHG